MIFYSDITIIGAGIIGSSLAYHLSKLNNNKKIMLIDKQSIGSEASGLSAGTIWSPIKFNKNNIFKFKDKFYKEYLAAGTIEIIKELEKKGYQTGWKQSGALMFADTNSIHFLNNLYQKYKKEGFLINKITDPKTIEPELSNKNIKLAIFSPLSGYVNPSYLTNSFAEDAIKNGVVLKENTEITKLEKNNYNFKIESKNGDIIYTKKLVLANGVHIPKLSNQLGVEVPIIPIKGCIWIPEEIFKLKSVLFSAESYSYWQKNKMDLHITHDKNNNLLTNHLYIRPSIYGSQFGFFRKECDINDYSIEEKDILENKNYLEKYIPNIKNIGIGGYWTGIMPFSKEGNFIIKSIGNLHIIGGFGPSGIMHGPMATKIFAKTI